MTVVASSTRLPEVTAGPDQTILQGAGATLISTATFNGQPNNALRYQWSLISGSGAVLADPNAASTLVTFPAAGVYSFRVTAAINQVSSSDDVIVYVNAAALTVAVSRNGDTVREPNTPIVVQSDDARTQRVALLIDGQIRATETGDTLSYFWDTRLLSGRHEVQAVAYDDAGVIASRTIPVNVR
jgi:hypothetical protein